MGLLSNLIDARDDRRINRQVKLQQALEAPGVEQARQGLIPRTELALNDAGVTDPNARFGVGYQLGSAQGTEGLNQATALANDVIGSPTFSPLAANTMQATMKQREREARGQQLDNLKKELDVEGQLFVQRDQLETGGRPREAWLTDVRAIDDFGMVMQTVRDLQVMNEELGKEVLPGRARGVYELNRTYLTNQLGNLNKAGALSGEEIAFYSGYIPEWSTFSTWSGAERAAKLNRLMELVGYKTQSLVSTTANTAFPTVMTRGVNQILGEPAPPEGAQPIDSLSLGDMGEGLSRGLEEKLGVPRETQEKVTGAVRKGFLRGLGP